MLLVRSLLVGTTAVLLSACSGLLGYDDVSFEDSTGGSQSGGSGSTSGGAPSGGAAGTASGGAPSGGGAPGGGTAGAASGGAPSGGGAPGGGGAPTGGTGGGTTGDKYESYRQQCFDQINQYRATLGLSPYTRWTDKEACADGEAKSDSQTGKPHGAFPSCGESAQNECPGYPSLSSTVTTCLAQMWAEGPGADFQAHGHYINMSSTKYSKVACGFYESPNGVWAVQDFQ